MKKILGFVLAVAFGVGISAIAFAADQDVSVKGHLIDSFCYAVMGAHGPSHQKCAMGCAKDGIAVGLVETGSDKMFVLLPPKNAKPIPKSVIGNMENEVTVTGKEYSKGGVNFITVSSVK